MIDSGSSDSDEEGLNNNHQGTAEVDSSLEDYRVLQEQLKEVNIENDKLKKEVALALKAIEEFERSKPEFEEIRATKDVLESDLQSLRKNFEALHIENEGLQQKMEASVLEKDEKEKSLEEFKNEIQKLKDLISTLESEREVLNQSLEERAQDVATLDEKLYEMNKQKEALSYENLVLLSKVQDAEKSISQHADEANLNMKLATDELSSKIKELLAENESLKVNLEDGHKREQDLTQRLADLQENIIKAETLAAEVETVNLQLVALKSEHVASVELVDKLTSENSSARSHFDEAISKLGEVTNELEQLKEENSTLIKNQSELQAKLDDSNAQQEIASSELNDIRKQIGILAEEKSAMVMELEQVRMNVIKEQELQKSTEQISVLQQTNKELIEKSSDLEKKLDEENAEFFSPKNSSEELESQAAVQMQEMAAHTDELNAEREKLSAENSNLRSELDLTAIKLGEVTKEVDQLKEENSTLIQTQSTLQSKVDDSSAQREIDGTELDNLRREISVIKEENAAIIQELEHARTDIDAREKEAEALIEQNSALQQANEETNDKISNLKKSLEEKLAEVLSLKNSSEEHQKEAADRVQGLTEKINVLQTELDLLHNQKRELESQVVMINEKCAQCQLSMKDFEDKLTSKILKQENSVAIVGSSFNNLVEHCRQLKNQLQKTHRKLDAEVTICREKNSEIKKFMEIRKELEKSLEVSQAEKLNRSKEVVKIHNQLQTLEVHLRLALQKLKITESQCKDKEKVLRGEVSKLEEAGKVLEERIKALSVILALTKHELNRIVKLVELGITDIAVRLYELETVFAQKHDCIGSRLSVFIAEVVSLKSELHSQLSEKQEMNYALGTLELRSNKNEESISALKFVTEDLKAQLTERDKQIEQMLGKNTMSDKKLKELEKIVLEKEEEILARNEEKREAIRQLCFLLEHYREKNDLLLTRLKFTR